MLFIYSINIYMICINVKEKINYFLFDFCGQYSLGISNPGRKLNVVSSIKASRKGAKTQRNAKNSGDIFFVNLGVFAPLRDLRLQPFNILRPGVVLRFFERISLVFPSFVVN